MSPKLRKTNGYATLFTSYKDVDFEINFDYTYSYYPPTHDGPPEDCYDEEEDIEYFITLIEVDDKDESPENNAVPTQLHDWFHDEIDSEKFLEVVRNECSR